MMGRKQTDSGMTDVGMTDSGVRDLGEKDRKETNQASFGVEDSGWANDRFESDWKSIRE